MTDFKLKQTVIDCSHPATIQQALSRFDEYTDHLKNEPDESPIVVLDSLSMLLLNQLTRINP